MNNPTYQDDEEYYLTLSKRDIDPYTFGQFMADMDDTADKVSIYELYGLDNQAK